MILVKTHPIISCPAPTEQQIKKHSQVLMNKIHNEFSDVFQELDVMKAYLVYTSSMTASHTRYPQEGSICAPGAPERRNKETKESTSHTSLGMDETSEWCNSFLLLPKQMVKYKCF